MLKNSIMYNGIDRSTIKITKNFKCINKQIVLEIPRFFPNIYQINKVSVKFKLLHSEIIKPTNSKINYVKGKSNHKLYICGVINIYIDYIDFTPESTVHNVKIQQYIGEYIELLNYIKDYFMIKPIVRIEDIYTQAITDRLIYNNIILIFDLNL